MDFAAKHWQYSLRHFDFLQVHPMLKASSLVKLEELGLAIIFIFSSFFEAEEVVDAPERESSLETSDGARLMIPE
jgi:hypothetical protein